MDADIYQEQTQHTEIYTLAAHNVVSELNGQDLRDMLALHYCAMKLCGEAGETTEQVAKAIRDDYGRMTPERVHNIARELGDVCWYIARMADLLGFSLTEIMEMNLEKLAKRKDEGKLQGDGSDR